MGIIILMIGCSLSIMIFGIILFGQYAINDYEEDIKLTKKVIFISFLILCISLIIYILCKFL